EQSESRKVQRLEANCFRPSWRRFTSGGPLSPNCCRRKSWLRPIGRNHRVLKNAQATNEPVKHSDKSSRGLMVCGPIRIGALDDSTPNSNEPADKAQVPAEISVTP